jgi:hypothetical protein
MARDKLKDMRSLSDDCIEIDIGPPSLQDILKEARVTKISESEPPPYSLLIKCKKGHIKAYNPQLVIDARRFECVECLANAAQGRHQKIAEEFRKHVEINGHVLVRPYVKSNIPVVIRCPAGGVPVEYEIHPQNIRRHENFICHVCAPPKINLRTIKRRRITAEMDEFLNIAVRNKFEILENPEDLMKQTLLRCAAGHKFKIIARWLLVGVGCPDCESIPGTNRGLLYKDKLEKTLASGGFALKWPREFFITDTKDDKHKDMPIQITDIKGSVYIVTPATIYHLAQLDNLNSAAIVRCRVDTST